jgi:hypothetical protein
MKSWIKKIIWGFILLFAAFYSFAEYLSGQWVLKTPGSTDEKSFFEYLGRISLLTAMAFFSLSVWFFVLGWKNYHREKPAVLKDEPPFI